MSDTSRSNPEPDAERVAGDRPSPAEVALAEFLAEHPSASSEEFDAFCARRPELADALRRLHEQYRAVLPVLREPPEAGDPSATSVFHPRRGDRRPPSTAAAALPQAGPGAVIGDFRLVSLIGSGGMGQVWEAEQVSLRRKVALKLVRPDRVSARALELFAREARAGGRLHHPGIVTVHASGESDGLAWIAMELVEGGWTLRDAIDDIASQDEVPPGYDRQTAELVAAIADALQAAHDAGVIHRDLKPQNVLIQPDDRPRITDFGLARITDETALSQSGELAGTYFYMSPEQVATRRMGLDHRTDVFSLGVVLYEMLALRRPFQGDTSHQIAAQIVTKDPPDLWTVRSRIPRDLVVITGKALEKDPDKRYQSMEELAADLRRFLGDEPILAKPPTSWERAAKWARRHPTKSVASAVAVVAFVVISLLLAENVRARGEVGRQNTELAEQKREAEALAAAEKARADEVLRLSALQDSDQLIAEADRLWPPHPENIDAYRAWIAKAERLVGDLDVHHTKREELRERALPQTEEEREADRQGHPEFERIAGLHGEIAARRAALLQRRDGVEADLPELDWAAVPDDPAGLLELASPLVALDRESFGREAEGLVLAQRALELAEGAADDAGVAAAAHVLSRALFALGRDEQALEASGTALAVAPEAEREAYQTRVTELERRVKEAGSEQGLADAAKQLAELEAELAAVEARVGERLIWRFPDTDEGGEDRWWHANLTRLIGSLEGLQETDGGLLSDSETAVSAEHGWSVPRRLALAERLRDGLAEGGEWHARWQDASDAIRSHPDYGGLTLAPQVGLVPLGPDPASGLWEFWHVATGAKPQRDADGRLVLTEEMGVVLVLIPGGSFWMGAQADDPDGRNHDPRAQSDEGPVHEVTLSAYFLSKYELTQGQWQRMTGWNRSAYGPQGEWSNDWTEAGVAATWTSPVTNVSWSDCMDWLPRLGLRLPSEAQWENGCRAGTESAWWPGSELESLEGVANIMDAFCHQHTSQTWTGHEMSFNDGATVHAPIGTYAANEFGLHEVHGNVWEWCLDGYDGGFYGRVQEVDPEAPWDGAAYCVNRGGSFSIAAVRARSALRYYTTPSNADSNLGVRPARVIP